ncbi:MAG: class I SAM-dependent methyltransferase [Gammaproteobacteria bacterium]|nr:class I SAM-dependent methyltransferase [Gammaproteobacteria bacterium]
MHPEAYRLMARVEDLHWWFRARREIIRDAIARLPLGPGARILEAGCGTGGNLEMLGAFGELQACEPDREALAVARAKGSGRVEHGHLPDGMPRDAVDLDLVCAFDVLEHIDDDAATAAELGRRLAPGGHLVVTVPAFGWLWSAHDEAVAHKRRYTRPQLVGLLRSAGLEVRRCSYFNTLLFPVVALVRLGRRLLRLEDDGTAEMALPGRLLNRLLYAVFRSERHLLARFDLPFGVSLLAVAVRPDPAPAQGPHS